MEWKLTDDDSMQHVQKISETKYRLIEMSPRNPDSGCFRVYTNTIDVADYLDADGNADEELLSILHSYAYDDAAHVRREYGDAANQIICECIFETHATDDSTTRFVGTEQECRAFISEYIQSAGCTNCQDEEGNAILMKKRYIVRVTEINYGYAVIETDNMQEAEDMAQDAYNAGNFVWTDSTLSGFEVEEDNTRKTTCLNCGAENIFAGASNDENGWHVSCSICGGSYDIIIEDFLVPNGTKVNYSGNGIGIVDGNDADVTDEYANINYYVCPLEFTCEKVWSSHYHMLRRNEFEIIDGGLNQ